MRINLFTNWYRSDRDNENEECLKRNINNPLIDKIYLLCDDDKEFPAEDKIIGVRIDHRPTYNDFFNLVNSTDPDISIISNSDIYFDETLSEVDKLGKGICYALSRWDDIDGELRRFDRIDSQDVWMFKGKINPVAGDFPLGVLGCDNRIAYELKVAGYRVRNTSLSIRSCHIHAGNNGDNSIHDQSVKIEPPYRYLPPDIIRPFLSIVTRHYYKRVEWFEHNKMTVNAQDDKDFEHVILEDNIGIGSHKANLMFAQNKDKINGEYVFMLDDDDFLTTNDFVSDIKKIAEENDYPAVIFVQMTLGGRLIPSELSWKTEKMEMNHIGTSCFVMRSDWWLDNIDHFTDLQTGDFNFINTVYNKKPTVYWQEKIYSEVNNIGSVSGL